MGRADSGGRGHRSNLPQHLTTFIGRRDELAHVKGQLAAHRLLTLTGVGGVGKTRLALQVAEDLSRRFPDGVRMVALDRIQNPDLLLHTVTAALGLRDEAGEWDLPALVARLEDERLLLVLDNCEHLLDACASFVTAVLRRTQEVRILATSREALGVAGERTVPLPPLSLPDRDGPPVSPKSLAKYDSVRLLVDRAALVSAGFTVDESNGALLSEICRQLEGIPLSIELAAVRLRAMSPQELLHRLDRFRLQAGWPGVPPRQRTLYSLVDWSFQLCTPPEQRVWARCSMFRDGFELEAAEAVCSDGDLDPDTVLEALSGLIDKSVLSREESRGRSRYRMLETLREFGLGRLAESGDTDEVQRRHWDWYRRLAQQVAEGSFGADQLTLFSRLRQDHANLRIALEHGLTDPDRVETAQRMAAGLSYYWQVTGLHGEGRRWLDQALSLDTRPTRTRVRALWADAWLALLQGELSTARLLLKESGALAERLHDESGSAWVAQLTAYADMNDGRLAECGSLYRQALSVHRALDDEPAVVLTLIRMAILAVLTMDIEAGIDHCREGLQWCERNGVRTLTSNLLWVLGILRWRSGDTTGAVAAERESIRLALPFDDPMALARALEVLAWVAATDGQTERAATLLGALDGLWRSFGGEPFLYLRGFHDECETQVRSALGPAAYRSSFARGTAMSYADLLADALEETPHVPEPQARRLSPLTHRETQIAELISQGMSNKEIAANLMIAQRTVEGHVEHILTKLGFTSRVQIAAWTVAEGR
ncbi:LuxR C-terminal-related transcriptional regulator [Actinoallomurus sp. NPDC050550]|uniref:ATP-binding protein n=1 Tax=Actinoallomurus sp. NPDC050550 TaxID=3154937 RepID=UPI0033D156DA